MSRLHELAALGQSVWLDNLTRRLVSSGGLRRLISEDAVTGVTSNPTIFANAISTGDDYDGQLRALSRAGASLDELYVSAVTEDIRGAADALRPVWVATAGGDGFASVEVSPTVAHDTGATVEEAREWVKRVHRDNLLVKVPANPAGIRAIERLTAEGISVNVTLIFSLWRYREVAEAYLSGLEGFLAAGGDLRSIASFASFFVSRVDAEVDRRLDELIARATVADAGRLRAFKGKIGIANARAAYGIFEELFSGRRWRRLAAHGARVQKPLWASTGVKDPSYPDMMYVESLIAPGTVNTMPEATIRAFQDHGDVERGPFGGPQIAEANELLDGLAGVDVDYDDVTARLGREGVAKFCRSFDDVMKHLASKQPVGTRR